MKSNNNITIIEGEIFNDHRGQISSLNNLRFDDIKRCYFVHHHNTSVIRAWHGHKYEKKWFYCIKGSFNVALVEIDNWENPSKQLDAQMFHISEQKSQIICVPEGYANGIKACEEGSILLVYSNKILDEALSDSWRYDSSMWVDWSKY